MPPGCGMDGCYVGNYGCLKEVSHAMLKKDNFKIRLLNIVPEKKETSLMRWEEVRKACKPACTKET